MSLKGNTTSHQERLMREALDIISGARRAAYGPPERNFERIGLLWSAYIRASEEKRPIKGVITPLDVCHMLDLVKLARLIETPDHEDSMRDRFGYQGCYVDLVYNSEKEEELQDWPAATEKEQGIQGIPRGMYGSQHRNWEDP